LNAEKVKKSLENQMSDLQNRLSQAENQAFKSGRREVEALENRVNLI
jgi:hypothetical protein